MARREGLSAAQAARQTALHAVFVRAGECEALAAEGPRAGGVKRGKAPEFNAMTLFVKKFQTCPPEADAAALVASLLGRGEGSQQWAFKGTWFPSMVKRVLDLIDKVLRAEWPYAAAPWLIEHADEARRAIACMAATKTSGLVDASRRGI